MSDRKTVILFAVLLTVLGVLMLGLTAKASAAPPVPDQTTTVQKYTPDQVVQQKQVYTPDQVVQQKHVYTPDQTKSLNVGGMLFERVPCQPVRNIIRRVIREKIKDRLVPTPPGFFVSGTMAAMASWPAPVCSAGRCPIR